MKKSILSRSFSVLLALCLAFSMICINTSEVNAASGYSIGMSSSVHVGEEEELSIYNTKTYEGESNAVTTAKSSKPKVLKVYKVIRTDYSGNKTTVWKWKALKAGKAKIVLKYKTKSGKTGKIKHKVQVKKYPNEIRKLTINGKAVNVRKNKFSVTRNGITSESIRIKLKLKKGWSIESASGRLYTSGSTKDLKGVKKKLKKGKAISFDKKYNEMFLFIYMKNKKGDRIGYDISLLR